MTAVATAARTRITPGQTFRNVAAITRRNLLRFVRLPQLLLFATVQPVMFLLLFNYVFGGAITTALPAAAGGSYLNFLIPGLLVQIATFGSGQTAFGLAEDLTAGVIDRFRSLPMARSAVLAGRTIADVVRNGLVLLLMMAVAAIIGWRPGGLAGTIGALGIALFFSYAMSWVMATVGLLVKTPEAVQSAVFLPVFPLVFASSVFVPTQTMPDWLRVFADNQPITVTVNAMRGLLLGEGALLPGDTVTGQVFLALAWAAAILALFAPLAVRVYRRTVS